MIDFSEIQRKVLAGIPLENLEARLRPFNHKNIVGSSEGGFLAPDERLMDVVRADYDTLCSLGKSYREMAQLAAEINNQYERETYARGGVVMRKIRRLIAQHWKPVTKLDRKRFTFSGVLSAGFQECPWDCQGINEFGYPTASSGHVYVMEKGRERSKEVSDLFRKICDGHDRIYEDNTLDGWDEKVRAMSLFEESIGTFGGLNRVSYLDAFTVITDLTPHLIASHHFFQGDACYRTDPKKLLQVTARG